MPRKRDFRVFKMGAATVVTVPKWVQEEGDIRKGDIVNWTVGERGQATITRKENLADAGRIVRY